MPVSLRRVSTPGWVALGATALFLLVSLWWLLEDGRVSFFDAGGHQYTALTFRDGFGDGHPFRWFTFDAPPVYPPLTQLVGALATFVAGISTTTMVMGQNLVFVPMLVAGCYGAGTILYDRRVGALAAIFALGSPLLASQFHVFMLDAPQTAAIALSVWLVLASRRFSDPRLSLLAGVATGIALMTKNTSVFFLAGLIAAGLLRGGWRQWRGLALYAVGALAIAGAWYAVHFEDQLKFAGGAAVAGSSELQFDPPAFSFEDLTWYFWDALNWQLFLPLTVLVVIGVVPALRRVLPRPGRDDPMAEFLAGGFVAWLLVDLLANNDPRYTMPCLVYLAVVGTGWTVQIGSRLWRRAAMGAVVAVSVVTFATTSFGIGPDVVLHIADHDPPRDNLDGQITVMRSTGFIVGGPEDGGHLADVFRAAHDAGARQLSLDRSSVTVPFFNPPGLEVMGRSTGLRLTPRNEYSALGPNDIYLVRAEHGTIDAPPCTTIPEGDIYLLRGPDVRPLAEADNLWCPTRSPETYAAAGAEAARRPDAQEARARAALGRMLDAAHDQGIRQVFFEDSVVSHPALGGAASLYAQARAAGIEPPPGGLIANISPTAGMYVYAIPTQDNPYPPVCVELPDGGGLVAFRGSDKQTPFYAENLYCPTRTPTDYQGPLAD